MVRQINSKLIYYLAAMALVLTLLAVEMTYSLRASFESLPCLEENSATLVIADNQPPPGDDGGDNGVCCPFPGRG